MSNDHAQLIGIVGGRAFTIRLAENTDRRAALDFVTGRLGPGRGNAPDSVLLDEWIETVEGFRVRGHAVGVWTVGRKDGEWAVAE